MAGGEQSIGHIAVVSEWENAGAVPDETALKNICTLGERIVEASQFYSGVASLVMVSDPQVNSQAGFETALQEMRRRFSGRLDIVAVSAPGARYIDQKIAGIGAVDSDVIVFADSDCNYRPGWLGQLLAPLQDSGVDYSHGRNMMMTDTIWGQAAAAYWFYPMEVEVPSGPNAIYFSNLAIRRSSYARHPFPGNPGNRVACAMWLRGLNAAGLKGVKTLAGADHPPSYGLRDVFLKAIEYGTIDDSRYVARGMGRGARLGRAAIRLVREILHTLKRSFYVAATLKLSPLRIPAILGIGLVYSVTTGVTQIWSAAFANPPIPKPKPVVRATVLRA